MQRIRLADSNPHDSGKNDPRTALVRRVLNRWWGRDIIVGNPRRPQGETLCGTAMVWPIIGPPELLDMLDFHGLSRVTCGHCFAVASWQPETEVGENDRIAV